MSNKEKPLAKRIVELEVDVGSYEETQSALRERVKELNCLYGFAKLIEKENTSIPEICRGLVELVPPGWQYPEKTCARLTLTGSTYASVGFRRTQWRQAAPVKAAGTTVGMLEVCYLEEFPEFDEGPFLKEERNLINNLCEWLGRIYERYQSESELRKSRNLLEIQKSDLERKNVALQELLLQLEIERSKMQSQIHANVETILKPIITEMRLHTDASSFVEVLASSLDDITSSFSSTIRADFSMLSPREIEIANMIRSGLTSKEIGQMIGISDQTVEKHRASVRNKLGIKGKKTNLVSFLQSM